MHADDRQCIYAAAWYLSLIGLEPDLGAAVNRLKDEAVWLQ